MTRFGTLLPTLALPFVLSAAGLSAAEAPKPRVVLVEADGSDEELSAFVARLESELSDRDKLSFSDARLAGATLGELVGEPEGERAKAFRAEWPGEHWAAVSLSPCRVDVSRMFYSDTTPEGYRVQRVVENVRVECPATVRLVDAASGKERKPLSVTGTTSFRRNEGEDGESAELRGARDAAEKAAKKLPSALGR